MVIVLVALVSHSVFCYLSITSKASGEGMRERDEIFVRLLTLSAPRAAILATVLSC